MLIYAFVIPGGMGHDGVTGLIISGLRKSAVFLYKIHT